MDSAGIPWYSTGTVNVTQGSSNVAGVGTNWVNAGLKVGDIFTIDKSRLYQITAVNSNTSLTLQEAYQGATGTAQVYFVIRNFAGTMQAQIAAQVSELVNKYESYIDTELKQITGPAGPTSFPYRGTWATGRTYNGLDVVQYNNQLYMALYGHTSTSANAPGASGTAWTQLTFDAAFSAVKAELAVLANAGAKNQINMMSSFDGASKTQNGITYTRNDDGTVTVNGTCTNFAYYYIKNSGAFTLKKGSYTLSLEGAIDGMNITIRKTDDTSIVANATNNFKNTFMLNADTAFNYFWIYANNGTTANNLVVKPMLRDAAITDGTYVPYGMSNADITAEMSDTGFLTLNGDIQNIYYRKKNGVVYITTFSTPTKQAIPQGIVSLGMLPAGFRPFDTMYFTGFVNDLTTVCRWQIKADGELILRNEVDIRQGAVLNINAFYPI